VPSECKKASPHIPRKLYFGMGLNKEKFLPSTFPSGGERGGRRELETPVIQASCMQPLSENTYTTAFLTYLTLRRAQLLCQGQVPSECKKASPHIPRKLYFGMGLNKEKFLPSTFLSKLP
jgi:hypothetical protein